jgi:hypothetical protein
MFCNAASITGLSLVTRSVGGDVGGLVGGLGGATAGGDGFEIAVGSGDGLDMGLDGVEPSLHTQGPVPLHGHLDGKRLQILRHSSSVGCGEFPGAARQPSIAVGYGVGYGVGGGVGYGVGLSVGGELGWGAEVPDPH